MGLLAVASNNVVTLNKVSMILNEIWSKVFHFLGIFSNLLFVQMQNDI